MLPAEVALEIVHRDAALPQLALEFIFGVRTLHFRKFVFDFAVAGDEVQLFCAFEKNFIVDEFIKNVQLKREGFFLRRLLALGAHARAVVLVHGFALDVRAVYRGPDIRRRLSWVAAARERQKKKRSEKQTRCGRGNHPRCVRAHRR